MYHVDNNDVFKFVKKDASILPILIEAYHKILQYFLIPDITLSVEFDKLVINVTVEFMPFEEACEILDKLDADWWLDASEKISDKVSIQLRYVKCQ